MKHARAAPRISLYPARRNSLERKAAAMQSDKVDIKFHYGDRALVETLNLK